MFQNIAVFYYLILIAIVGAVNCTKILVISFFGFLHFSPFYFKVSILQKTAQDRVNFKNR